jgi:hypothetical protein
MSVLGTYGAFAALVTTIVSLGIAITATRDHPSH